MVADVGKDEGKGWWLAGNAWGSKQDGRQGRGVYVLVWGHSQDVQSPARSEDER